MSEEVALKEEDVVEEESPTFGGGWTWVDGPDNAWHCGNNIVQTLQKKNDKVVYSSSGYRASFYILKVNGIPPIEKGDSSFDYSGVQTKAEIFEKFGNFLDNLVEKMKGG